MRTNPFVKKTGFAHHKRWCLSPRLEDKAIIKYWNEVFNRIYFAPHQAERIRPQDHVDGRGLPDARSHFVSRSLWMADSWAGGRLRCKLHRGRSRLPKAHETQISISDGSAVLTGVLMAYVLPPGVSFMLPVLGAVMAMFIGKQLMGGLGYNIFNPALLARAFLMVTFPVAMTSAWISPTALSDLGAAGLWIAALNGMPDAVTAATADAVTSATPLMTMSAQGIDAVHKTFGMGTGLYGSFFVGYRPGCIGETSGLLLLLGGLFLMWKKYITWHIPVSMLGTIALLTWAFGGPTLFTGDPLLAILSGGAMLGAFYMATDYVTSPANRFAQIIYGMGIGALTVLIRIKGGYPEGVCYAILLMNCLSIALDGWFKRKRFSPEEAPQPEKPAPAPQEAKKAEAAS